MCHPMAPKLLENVEHWVLAESQERHPSPFLDAMRQMARTMMGLGPA
jgi:hypothetical protein